MELHQIRYFLALCDERTFTRSAKRCGVSQPSLSNAIKSLELEFGGKLFHRGAVKGGLSKLGQEIRPHFEKLMQCVEAARRQAAIPDSLSPDIVAPMDEAPTDEAPIDESIRANASALRRQSHVVNSDSNADAQIDRI
jgi:hypothetical protein